MTHEYDTRIEAELNCYNNCINVHELPLIFHYWSNRYLRPKVEQFGFSHPDSFFSNNLAQMFQYRAGQAKTFLSIGSGNCDTEVRVAKALADADFVDFQIECLDLNSAMLQRGQEMAVTQGVSQYVACVYGDLNSWQPVKEYDAVIANQSLHHVLNLEGLFSGIKKSLKHDGLFIVSDMIGRNGHQRWPEALRIVREFWRELPQRYHYNQQLKRYEETFLNWDCSVDSFEGIRAQDILPLLVSQFKFDMFLGFANAIDPFVDRSFGHNFDANCEKDRAFIDRVHQRDEAEISAGSIKPTHMFAVMRAQGEGARHCLGHLTPEFCIRMPDYDGCKAVRPFKLHELVKWFKKSRTPLL